jgi:prolyl-tRNA synthetase
MNDLYKVKDSANREFALGPTHEEVVVPLAKRFINSFRDLPIYLYQFQNKFRMELRAKSGLLRGREFLMKDLYSFHITEQNFNKYYEKVKQSYFKIFGRMNLKPYFTLASGGTFSKYSHEFQIICPAGEDIIYICDKCGQAINKEIKAEVSFCPNCQNNKFKEEKSIEVGNIFTLKNKFTKPFELVVADETEKNQEIIMGCYGIGLGRLMGTIVEIHHDEKGIIWPKSVAPFQIHLIQIEDNQKVKDAVEKIYSDFKKIGVEVLYDDRTVQTPGEKFADADLIGIPIRIVVSERTLKQDSVEIKKRGEEKMELVKIDHLQQFLNQKEKYGRKNRKI